jgi:hypothetical protein
MMLAHRGKGAEWDALFAKLIYKIPQVLAREKEIAYM